MARPRTHTAHAAQLPMRDGVSPSCVALPAGPWATVLDFLSERLPAVSREAWATRMQRHEVLHAQGQAVHVDQAYTPHIRLYYYRHVDDEPVLPFEAKVVFQDAHVVVADKPHFMPVTPTGRYVRQSLLVQLKHTLGLPSLSPIHRIDRETAGLVVFCVQPHTRNAYQALFRERQVHKTYEAVAAHHPERSWPHTHRSRLQEDAVFFRMREVAGTPNSETQVRLLQVQGEQALYQLEPLTGKRHQLRVHMMSLGLPLLGDQFYPQVLRGPDEPEDYQQPLQLLARSIAFTDPITGDGRYWVSQRSLCLRQDITQPQNT